MARHLPQDVFDVMAISQAMARVTPTPALTKQLEDAVNGYRSAYPDENFDTLWGDLAVASTEVQSAALEIYDALFDVGREDERQVYFAILKELNELVVRKSRNQRPFLKRVFGGTRFNYETRPIVDKVKRCKENVASAAMMILTKQLARK